MRLELKKMLSPVITDSTYSISKSFARKVTSSRNQSVSMMTVGSMGDGKSSSNIMLGINCARQIARYKTGPWTKYFNLDHIGILTKEEIYRVIEIDTKYGIIMPDDVGAAWNSRKFQDSGNIMMNDILQTSRTENQIVLMSLPDSILIDKVPRSLCQHLMVMDTPQFDIGVTVGKFFRIVRQARQDKTYFMYEDLGGMKFQKALFARPPDSFMIPYEQRRRDIAHKFKMDSIAEHQEKLDHANQPKEIKVSKKDRILEIDRDVKAGVYSSLKDGLVQNNLAKDMFYARNVISANRV
ncbi:MAG TPA: hypothetical protein VMV77_02930 [Bacteroidales bacterium]|nr:hypothetical protein [Bacteroidales bacterium]